MTKTPLADAKSLGLIGHTGFVGGQLDRQCDITHRYNSRTIGELSGQTLDMLICAGAPAIMWAANKDPQGDWSNLATIVDAVAGAKIGTLVLISSIAVFDDMGAGYTESTAQYECDTAYGRNRHRLEVELAKYCDRLIILRLPALFAAGLKKNFLFDLANPVPSYLKPIAYEMLLDGASNDQAKAVESLFSWDEDLGMYAFDRVSAKEAESGALVEAAVISLGMEAARFTHSESTFQFYNVARLAEDIDTIRASEVDVVNIGSPPLLASHVHQTLMGRTFENTVPRKVTQNIRSEHASLFGEKPPYTVSEVDILADMKLFHASLG